MKPEFSEFSYAFALSYEIAAALKPDVEGVPLFPSLVEEAKRSPGATSVPAGWPLFLRFKLADYLTTSRARQWAVYGKPYFRLTIQRRTHANQHNLLKALSQQQPEVYYAAPAFYRELVFQEAFVSDQVLQHSVYVPFRALPRLVDNKRHYITYEPGASKAQWHSRPGTDIEADISGEAWLGRITSLARDPRTLGIDYFLDLRRQLIQLLHETLPQETLFLERLLAEMDDLRPSRVMRDIGYLLVTYFGAEMIVLRPVQ